jgi:glycerol-3-phosphate dehydrogenase subunit B
LTAAWRLAAHGQKVRVVAKGWGATYWGSGCIDLLGYYPTNNSTPIDTPISAIARLGMEQPKHPYSQVTIKTIGKAMHAFQDLCEEAGYPLVGTLEKNWLLPTTAGAFRPTCLAPETFIGGDITESSPMLLVGIEGFNDFYPEMAAANLQYQGIPAKAITIRIPSLQNQKRIDTMVLARYFDKPEAPIEVAEAVKPHLKNAERVGFPAILGLKNSIKILRILESVLGCRVFEIPGLPPSVPGIRLQNILRDIIHQLNGQVIPGMEVVNFQLSKGQQKIESIYTEAAARPTYHHAQNFILATGGILGGGIMTNPKGEVFDPIFDLQVLTPKEEGIWLEQNILDTSGHSVMSSGVQTDEHFNTGYENLYAVGGVLVGEFIRERSLEGIALVSGYQVGETLS